MKLSFVLGTRPEVIKLAPVILEAKRRRHKTVVALTGQHAHLAIPLLKFFGIEPSFDLQVMSANQSLTSLSARLLDRLDEVSDALKADFLVTQGDTTSAFVASYWAFCHRQRVAHVEAGLRTYRIDNPFPEEANRQLIGRIATLNFAPTKAARDALLSEHLERKSLFVTGNTAIDALIFTLGKLEKPRGLDAGEVLDPEVLQWIGSRPMGLVTAHRRESFGAPLDDLCTGLLQLLEKENNLCLVYPVHPNPNVRERVMLRLGQHPRIKLLPPLPYVAFVSLMQRANIILTDSGGVQEEAPSLRKPILVLRETSERPEGIAKGFAKLIGTEPRRICRESQLALKKGCDGKGRNPYGDGKAAARILTIMERFR